MSPDAEHEVESTFQTLKEEILELRKEVEHLQKKVDDLEYMERSKLGYSEDYL
jgi:archaellum component FlaC